jgi:hypothetical protein
MVAQTAQFGVTRWPPAGAKRAHSGNGIGIDSGLPDFRGNSGFWKAYPAFAHTGIPFSNIANPAAFVHMSWQAWGFYGHRLQLYRDTVPHVEFDILRQVATRMQHGSFVLPVTSMVSSRKPSLMNLESSNVTVQSITCNAVRHAIRVSGGKRS